MTDQTKEGTELIHLTYEGNFILECESTVVRCKIVKDDDDQPSPEEAAIKVEVELDKTTMHPQGGGQPTDIGIISSDPAGFGTKIDVEKVTIDRETKVVTHSGTMTNSAHDDGNATAPFEVGSKVRVCVDTDNRRLLSECHTAGHVVDSAMARCGQMLPPTKGYHFMEGPYVEYKGKIPQEGREALLENLKSSFQDLVNEDIDTTIQTLPKDEAEKKCNNIAQNFDFSDYIGDIRVVSVAGFPCPCGGTHCKSTGDLKARGWGIKGPIKCKKGVVRIRYGPDLA